MWQLITLCLAHPAFVFPTIAATRTCLAIANQHYGKAHHLDGQANAFRHALWNFLIAKRLDHKNKERVLAWTKNITDWHERAFPNTKMARFMDTHNNKVGRKLFVMYTGKSKEEITQQLLHMAQNAKAIHAHDKQSLPDQTLVYLKQS
ncbi:MAG: hypothetical protein HKP38_10725 [Croceitalea sp.]|nr:hypothetical protein [Croceitalea sp.]MBT8239316.1 hypothetical protein [Croceitalea sp.]NNC34003.1 hypothetical protein [Croceitalea sp.]NNL09686.1 hypothetical protein [Croceitalea sp.]NNM18446.1 hypothetical protein [Croceitalea sp.]